MKQSKKERKHINGNSIRFAAAILLLLIICTSISLSQMTRSRDNTFAADSDLTAKYIYKKSGLASWYGKRFHNRKTANGEIYNMYEFTAAHKELPFGTLVKVTDLKTRQSVLVRINDRGPFIKDRIIDLSFRANELLSGLGLTDVEIQGFLPLDESTELSDNKDFYFGYSLNYPLFCLHKYDFDIIGKVFDLNEALEYLHYLNCRSPERVMYLLIPPKRILNICKDTSIPLYIGFLKSFTLIPPGEVVNNSIESGH